MDTTEGYITLSRRFFKSDMWTANRTYNESEAWLDFIAAARYEQSEQTARVAGHDVKIRRGELALTQRTIAKKWGWTDRKVRTFISHLQREGMIEMEIRDGITVVRLINYDKYNYSDAASDAASDAVSDAASDTASDTPNTSAAQRFTATSDAVNDAASDAPNDTASDAASDAHTKKDKNKDKRKKDSSKEEPKERIDDFLVFFNSSVAGCSIPPIKSIHAVRRSMLNARIKEYGIDAVYEVVRKAVASSFLNGSRPGSRDWKASFDWMFGPKNFPKVLEGNYDDDNKVNETQSQQTSTADEEEWYPGWLEDQRRKEEAKKWQ